MEELLPIVVCIVIIFCLITVVKKSNQSKLNSSMIICPNPNCNYRGPGKSDGSKSGCLLLILLCLGILPGILYLLFCGKSNSMICPRCGMRIR